MTHKHKEVRDTGKSMTGAPKPPDDSRRPKLEIVLKADSVGSMEALVKAISEITLPDVDINIIHSSVGDVNKSDLLLAETGSRLIIGFQVDLLPGLESALREHHVEVRLYTVIYSVTADIKAIAESYCPARFGRRDHRFCEGNSPFQEQPQGDHHRMRGTRRPSCRRPAFSYHHCDGSCLFRPYRVHTYRGQGNTKSCPGTTGRH